MRIWIGIEPERLPCSKGVFALHYVIRAILPKEYPLLSEFLYEAIFQRDHTKLLPREVIRQPELAVFIADFGRPTDACLVAESAGKVVGAVWARILSGAVKGFGNLDDTTPELAISLYQEYRGHGIGTAMLKAMLALLQSKGCERVSLAVQKDNYAVAMYQSVGFRVVRETEEEFIMVCLLKEKTDSE